MTFLERQRAEVRARKERLGLVPPRGKVLPFPDRTTTSVKKIDIREEAPAPVDVPSLPVIHRDPERVKELDALREEIEGLKQHISMLIQDEEGPVFVPSPVKPIVRAVAKYYDTPLCRIVSMERMQDVVRVRHIAMYLAQKLSGRSLVAIGKVMVRDHTAIMHGCQKIAARLETDEKLQREIAELTAIIQAGASDGR